MEYCCAGGLRRVDPADRLAGIVSARIPGRRQHHAHARPAAPFQFHARQLAAGRRHQHRHEIGRHTVHQRLRLRIAQAHVELQHLRSRRRHHQSRVQETSESHRFHRRIDDAVQNLSGLRLGENRPIAIRSHAAGVRTGVAIEDGLVILSGRQRHNVSPVAQRDEAHLFATKKLFDYQPALQRAQRRFGLLAVLRDDHALARRQPVGLQHHRKTEAVECLARIGLVFDGHKLRRGHMTL